MHPALHAPCWNVTLYNGIWSQMGALFFVLGPALGDVLVLLGEPRLAFLINGLILFISAATLLFVRIPQREAAERPEAGEESWLSETLAGFRFLFRVPSIRR